MNLVKAKITQKKNVYVHNDLSQSAFYFKALIERKLADGNRDGIAYTKLKRNNIDCANSKWHSAKS
jgi:hypothetical protein